ncbi:GPI alpha-1,4-mannosyltransferase I, stabilizing subunit isoform X2 [Xylocopa sonorina]|uniref:GPI alpha-1,4-mannosyltransferase I, stabilizing subunit isoform X2 n=1 Tax=Xylocopa sonorina TaxID=1818115 RepID=UPI00403A9671
MILGCVRQRFIDTLIYLFFILIFQTAVKCNTFNARIRVKVQGTGFHRDLMYQIKFDHSMEKCYVAIYLQLPAALYANVNELMHLRRLGLNTACFSGETDVELFTEKAQGQNVTICKLLTDTGCNVSLPVHQRYQYATENNKYANITLPKPKLLLGCKERIKEYRISKLDLCSPCAEIVSKWREIPYIMDMEDLWTTPVGETNMLPVVNYVTLFLTVSCTMFLMRTIWKSVAKQHLKKE